MDIFKLVSVRTSGNTCQKCAHFKNDPVFVEEAYPGLTSFSSGYASVRDQDGFCDYNALYLSARDSCSSFVPRIS